MTQARVYTTAEACAMLRVTKYALYRLRDAGKLKSVQYVKGGALLWPAGPVDKLAAQFDADAAKRDRERRAAEKKINWRQRSA